MKATKTKPVELNESEWAIIKAVWEKEPCTAPEVQLALEKQTAWTYSTVRTLMDRMVGKQLLASEKVRNLTIYRARVTRDQAQKGELFSTLKRAFDGALTPMLQCLLEHKKLSDREMADLKRLIDSKSEKH